MQVWIIFLIGIFFISHSILFNNNISIKVLLKPVQFYTFQQIPLPQPKHVEHFYRYVIDGLASYNLEIVIEIKQILYLIAAM